MVKHCNKMRKHSCSRVCLDMMDIFKIVCHDLVKINPLGWTGLLRKLGLKNEQIEQVIGVGASPDGSQIIDKENMETSVKRCV